MKGRTVMGVTARPQVEEPSVVLIAHPHLGPRPPKAELASMRGIIVGFLLVLPFWLAVLAWLIRV